MPFKVTQGQDERGRLRFRVVDGGGAPVEVISDFLDSLVLRNYSAHTVRNYAHDLAAFFSFLELGVSDATGEAVPARYELVRYRHVERYVAWLQEAPARNAAPDRPGVVDLTRPWGDKRSPATINRHLAALKSFYLRQVEKDDGLVEKSPIPEGKRALSWLGAPPGGLLAHTRRSPGMKDPLRIRAARLLPVFLTDEEVRRYLDGLRTDRDRAMALLMVEGGARASEVLGLTFADIDEPFRSVRLHGKGRKDRQIEVHPLFFTMLQRYVMRERPREARHRTVFVALQGPRRGQPLTYQGLRTVFASNRRRTKLLKASPHKLRHTCATTLARAGMKPLVLQAFLGHEDVRSTMIYVHVSDDEMRTEYEQALRRREERREQQRPDPPASGGKAGS